MNHTSYRPLRNAIKLVSNATIVLTCRELLILFINWSLKQQKKSMEVSTKVCLSPISTSNFIQQRPQPHMEKKLSIMQINCETEFELLQLLDILYYTDNSINYKLFIKNLIISLNLTEPKKPQQQQQLSIGKLDESDSSDNQLQYLSSSQTKVLSRISMMACEFMLPEYKLLRKINWSSDDKNGLSDNDTGKYLSSAW